MEPTLYLHVGHPKTGSSYLQHNFYKNRDELHKQGICYPSVYPSGNNGYLLYEQDNIDILKPEYSNKSIFISCESLTRRIATNLDNINEKIFEIKRKNGYKKIEILLMIRDPNELLLSAYNQNIKRHQYHNEISYFIQNNSDILFKYILNFLKTTNSWNATSITVLNYSKIKNTIFKEALNWLTVEKKFFQENKFSVNRSLTQGELEIIKGQNKILNSAKIHPSKFPIISDALWSSLPEQVEPDKVQLSQKDKEDFFKKISPISNEINKFITEEHQYNLKKLKPMEDIKSNEFTFNKKQLSIIGKVIGEYIVKLDESEEKIKKFENTAYSKLMRLINRIYLKVKLI